MAPPLPPPALPCPRALPPKHRRAISVALPPPPPPPPPTCRTRRCAEGPLPTSLRPVVERALLCDLAYNPFASKERGKLPQWLFANHGCKADRERATGPNDPC